MNGKDLLVEPEQITAGVSSKPTTAFTAFLPDDEWNHEGKLYVRKFHEPEREQINVDERRKMKEKIPFLEEKDKSNWLCNIINYGPKPILLTYKASENTFAQSVLFGAVLAKQTLHHTGTSPDMRRVFDNPKDKQLRTEWLERKDTRPLFIQLWDAYPQVYEHLKQCDGKLVKLHYAKQILTITVDGTEHVLDVKTIRNDY